MYKVLLVDDEPFIIEGLNKIIDWESNDFVIAGNACHGREAMAILDSISGINILISDIRMPEMDGLELVKQVKAKYPDIYCILISAFDDFSYVKEAVRLGIENYILKPIDPVELTATLDLCKQKIFNDTMGEKKNSQEQNIIRNNILCRWISGRIERRELQEWSSLIQIDYHSGYYQAAVIRALKPNTAGLSDFSLDLPLLTFALHNICEETVNQSLKSLSFININNDIVILLDQKPDHHLLADALQKCAENCLNSIHASLFITVGEPVYDCLQLSDSYNSAAKLQEYQLVDSIKPVVFYDQISKTVNREFMANCDFEQLRNLLILRNKASAADYVNDLYSQLKNYAHFSPSLAYEITLECIITITSTVRSATHNIQVFADEISDIRSIISENRNLDFFRELILRLIGQAVDFLIQNDSQYSPIIQKIVNNLTSSANFETNLKFFANAFNINPDYLGRLFKNEVGESFSNYVNNLRMLRAKELLMNTNYKVNDISEKLGFTSPNYFFTAFKKHYGVTPLKFRGN